jgi:putative hydrolase
MNTIDPDPDRMSETLSRVTAAIRSGKKPLVDGGLVNLMASPEQRAVLDQVSGMMSLLEGHGDITMDRAGLDLVPSADRFSKVLRERRESARGLAKIVQQLIGLQAKLAQYAQGEAFITDVERAGGQALLSRAWEGPENLPSIREIREPQLWIDRMGAALPVAG